MEKLLTADDLAELVGVPSKTLADWRTRGLGPRFVRIGRHVRYRPSDVEAWLATRLEGEGRSESPTNAA